MTNIIIKKGEAEAISLAKNLGVKEVLLDEISARTATMLLDLKPMGTIFLLLKALEKEEIDLDDF